MSHGHAQYREMNVNASRLACMLYAASIITAATFLNGCDRQSIRHMQVLTYTPKKKRQMETK